MAKKKGDAATDKYLIDETVPRPDPKTGVPTVFYRVYYWAQRPDAAQYVEGAKFHWCPDSEHPTKAAAQERMAALKAGAKRKSLLVVGAT
jgi:hypothetical protein